MNTGTAFHKISSIIDSKVWGCLADTAHKADRYDKYLESKWKTSSIREYWSEREVNSFIDKLKVIFNQDIVIMRKDTIEDVSRRIKGVVGNNLSRL